MHHYHAENIKEEYFVEKYLNRKLKNLQKRDFWNIKMQQLVLVCGVVAVASLGYFATLWLMT